MKESIFHIELRIEQPYAKQRNADEDQAFLFP